MQAVIGCGQAVAYHPDETGSRGIPDRALLHLADIQPKPQLDKEALGDDTNPHQRVIDYFRQGREALDHNRPADAIRAFRLALLANPREPNQSERSLTHFHLGIALHAEGYLTAAAEQLEAWLAASERTSPTTIGHAEFREAVASHQGEALKRLTEIYTALGRRDEARGACERAVARDADDAEARYLLAALHLRQGRYPEASDLIFDTLHSTPDSLPRAIGAIAENGDHAARRAIIEYWQRKVTAAPDDAIGRAALGALLASDGSEGPALGQLNEAVRLDGKCGAAHAAMAELFISQKKWRLAARAADNAIRAGLSTAHVYFLKGRAHDALDQVDDAEDAIMESFQRNRSSPDALFLLAESAERHGEGKRCERLYRRILEDVDPKFAPAREKLVLLYLNSNRAEKAKECIAEFETLDNRGPAFERCRALLRLAESSETDGAKRLAEYQEDLKKTIASNPDDAATPVALAMSYLAVRDYKTAIAFTDQALRNDPHNIRAREFKATLEAKLLRFETAEAVVRGLLDDRPRDLGYQQKLLELALDQADNDAAVAILRNLLARDDLPKTARMVTHARLVQLFLAAERFDEALAAAKDALDEDPDNETRRDGYLAALSHSGRIQQAITTARTWLDQEPDSDHLRRRYIDLLQRAERHVEAEQQVLSWLADAPDDLNLNPMLIALFWGAKQWESALEIAYAGAEIREHNPVYQNLLGQTYMLAGLFDDAIELGRARAQATQAVSAYEELIALLLRAGRLTEAERTANKLLMPEAARRDAGQQHDTALIQDMRRILATIDTRLGRHEQAVQQLRLVHDMNPGDPGINNDLGYTWADAGTNLQQAEEMIRLAVGEHPREAAYVDSLGWVLYKMGRFEEAIVQLQRAVRHAETEDPTIFNHLADALYRTGRKQKARAAWEKAIELTKLDRAPPPSEEDKVLRKRVEVKLRQLADGKAVDTAPLGSDKPTSRPVAENLPRDRESRTTERNNNLGEALQPPPTPADVLPPDPDKKNEDEEKDEEPDQG
ncbi:MAG: tetratricopeptide repeat protein [Planctomycetota bacterium]